MEINKETALENERGYLIEFLARNYNVKQINILFSYSDTQRGNHYHKETEEFFYIIDGKVQVTIQDIRSGQSHTYIVSSKESFCVMPYQFHTLDFQEDTHILSFYSKEFDENNPDIFTL